MGWEHVGLLAASSIALSALCLGWFSVDRGLGVDDAGTPLLRVGLTTVLGDGGALAQFAVFWTRPIAR